jgi:plastocyanin
MITVSLTAAAAFLASAAPNSAATRGTLTGTVGPGFTITMSKSSVKAGTYAITIRDRSAIHDFHLTGIGVNKSTGISAVGTHVWTVRLRRGLYRFVCDPHRTIMHGVLKVT